MAIENGPCEDVFPIENGDSPASHLRKNRRVGLPIHVPQPHPSQKSHPPAPPSKRRTKKQETPWLRCDDIKHEPLVFLVKWSGSSPQYASKMCEQLQSFLNLGYCHGTTICEIFLSGHHCMLEEVVSILGSCSHLNVNVWNRWIVKGVTAWKLNMEPGSPFESKRSLSFPNCWIRIHVKLLAGLQR